QRHQSLIPAHRIACLDEQFDHRDVRVVADVRHLDFLRGHAGSGSHCGTTSFADLADLRHARSAERARHVASRREAALTGCTGCRVAAPPYILARCQETDMPAADRSPSIRLPLRSLVACLAAVM